MRVGHAAVIVAAFLSSTALGQDLAPTPGSAAVVTARAVLPSDTVIQVVPVEEISSINMKVGDKHQLQVASEVSQNGVVIIPRGSPVTALVSYRTGKGIGGKSAKFELTFETVSVRGVTYKLKGKHRQEGRGNTVGALLGSMIITGKSAVMASGQVVNAFTAEPIPAQ